MDQEAGFTQSRKAREVRKEKHTFPSRFFAPQRLGVSCVDSFARSQPLILCEAISVDA
jgi:hypothetical protein